MKGGGKVPSFAIRGAPFQFLTQIPVLRLSWLRTLFWFQLSKTGHALDQDNMCRTRIWQITVLQLYKKRSICCRLRFVWMRTANAGRISQSTAERSHFCKLVELYPTECLVGIQTKKPTHTYVPLVAFCTIPNGYSAEGGYYPCCLCKGRLQCMASPFWNCLDSELSYDSS